MCLLCLITVSSSPEACDASMLLRCCALMAVQGLHDRFNRTFPVFLPNNFKPWDFA